jgi:peptidoglycan/xylan/chitin deacetylase (PgdA/CDA1 family)
MPLINPFFRLPGRWSRRRARKIRMALQLLALAILLLVLLPAYVVYKPPKSVISYLQSRNPSVLFQIQTSRKIVALTIDDAPSPYTREILEILKENDATATFFVIGNQVPGNEEILADIVRAGHELGNHAMHDEPSVSLSSDVLAQEINQVDTIINQAYEQGGRVRSSHHFRPGSGVKEYWRSPRKLATRRFWGASIHTIHLSRDGE